MSKELKVTVVDDKTFTDIDFIPPSTFFIMDSLQNYHFVHTSDRKVAQDWVDAEFGKGKYTVKASKEQKTKSKLESGEISVRGSNTRRGFAPRLKGLK